MDIASIEEMEEQEALERDCKEQARFGTRRNNERSLLPLFKVRQIFLNGYQLNTQHQYNRKN